MKWRRHRTPNPRDQSEHRPNLISDLFTIEPDGSHVVDEDTRDAIAMLAEILIREPHGQDAAECRAYIHRFFDTPKATAIIAAAENYVRTEPKKTS